MLRSGGVPSNENARESLKALEAAPHRTTAIFRSNVFPPVTSLAK
jgi:hypothetical protein